MVNRRGFLTGAAGTLAALAADVKQVRITGVDVYPIQIPVTRDEAQAGLMHRYTAVEVKTDANVTGYSFAGPPVRELPAVRELLTGKDLFAVERHLQDGLGRWGGVEHAIWDAIGRIGNRPVHQLLGANRDRVTPYLTCVWPGKLDQSHVPYQQQADMAVKIQKAGFKGMKIRAWRPNPLDDADACGEIRAAVGPDFSIMFDRTAHLPELSGQRVWSYETGLKVARGLQRHNALWLEEPFARDDYEGPAKLASQVDIFITGGEGYQGMEAFHQCLQHRTYDILQPDGRQAGGILACRKVGFLAEASHVPCILHGTMGLMLAGWLQATLAIGAEWQEVALITPPLLPQEQWGPGMKVLRQKEMYRVENGEILAPELPGIGLDVNPDALKEFRQKT